MFKDIVGKTAGAIDIDSIALKKIALIYNLMNAYFSAL